MITKPEQGYNVYFGKNWWLNQMNKPNKPKNEWTKTNEPNKPKKMNITNQPKKENVTNICVTNENDGTST